MRPDLMLWALKMHLLCSPHVGAPIHLFHPVVLVVFSPLYGPQALTTWPSRLPPRARRRTPKRPHRPSRNKTKLPPFPSTDTTKRAKKARKPVRAEGTGESLLRALQPIASMRLSMAHKR